jgi:hypothetical protein
MAKWIKANGTVQTVEPKNGTDFRLEELKEYVNGYIQIISLPNDYKYLVCNEEGKLLGLHENRQATDILYFQNGIMDVVVGDVLVCDFDQIK